MPVPSLPEKIKPPPPSLSPSPLSGLEQAPLSAEKKPLSPPFPPPLPEVKSTPAPLPLDPPLQITKGSVICIRLSPSETEMKNSKPFSDESGTYLLSLLYEAGLTPETCLPVYLCPYKLEYLSRDSSQIPLWKEKFFSLCREVQPKAVFCFGERVSQILSVSDKGIEELRKVSLKLEQIPFFFHWDPLYILKKTKERSRLIENFKTFLSFLSPLK